MSRSDPALQEAHLLVAAQQSSRRRRQAARGAEAAQRRELVDESVDVELEQVLGTVEVLESVLSEVAQLQPIRKRPVDERRGRRRQDDLAAMRHRRDPCRAMDVDPDIRAVVRDRRPGVQSHPDLDGRAVGPGERGQLTLRLRNRGDRVIRGVEHDVEAVALGAQLGARIVGPCGAAGSSVGRRGRRRSCRRVGRGAESTPPYPRTSA